MDKRDDGGPAFPEQPMEWSNGGYGEPACFVPKHNPSSGMTLRDYFAGQALAGLMAQRNYTTTDNADFAHWSYCVADAMLAARQEGGQR